MRLGLNLGYWGAGTTPAAPAVALPTDDAVLVREAERLGYAAVWVAEAYGSDAPSRLGWLAAQTTAIGLGSAVMQIPARSPAATAMTAATLDTLSGGRFRLGLGVSGPQVSEGWHGVRFADPLGRTREYVEIVRTALARQRVSYTGEHWQLPLPDGPGKALKLGFTPPRARIPVYLAGLGPASLGLIGAIADGWLAIFFSPEHGAEQLRRVRAGAEAAGRDLSSETFDVVASVPVVVGEDLAACADRVRPYAALYLGGMGSRERNFYHRQASAMGFGPAADQVQEHFLAGRYREAAGAVPMAFLDQTSLLGPVPRIADRLHQFAAAGVTTLSVIPFPGPDPASARDTPAGVGVMRAVVEAAERAGLGG